MTTCEVNNDQIKEKQIQIPFKDHPFTKMLEILTLSDPTLKHRIGRKKFKKAKKWGLVWV